jgi:hypothetical protein
VASLPVAASTTLVPVPIKDPDGEVTIGWLVAVVDGNAMTGFVQLGSDFAFHRSSVFGVEQNAGDWLDADRVREIARSRLNQDETLGTPYLSYDVAPERVGWIVPVNGPGGSQRRLMVTGGSAFPLAGSHLPLH